MEKGNKTHRKSRNRKSRTRGRLNGTTSSTSTFDGTSTVVAKTDGMYTAVNNAEGTGKITLKLSRPKYADKTPRPKYADKTPRLQAEKIPQRSSHYTRLALETFDFNNQSTPLFDKHCAKGGKSLNTLDIASLTNLAKELHILQKDARHRALSIEPELRLLYKASGNDLDADSTYIQVQHTIHSVSIVDELELNVSLDESKKRKRGEHANRQAKRKAKHSLLASLEESSTEEEEEGSDFVNPAPAPASAKTKRKYKRKARSKKKEESSEEEDDSDDEILEVKKNRGKNDPNAKRLVAERMWKRMSPHMGFPDKALLKALEPPDPSDVSKCMRVGNLGEPLDEDPDAKKKKKATKKTKSKAGLLALPARLRKPVAELEKLLKPDKALQGHSLTQRLVSAIILHPTPSKKRGKKNVPHTTYTYESGCNQDAPDILQEGRGRGSSMEERIKMELRDVGIMLPDCDEEYQPHIRQDDVVCVELRQLQNQMRLQLQRNQETQLKLAQRCGDMASHAKLLQRLEEKHKALEKVYMGAKDRHSKPKKRITREQVTADHKEKVAVAIRELKLTERAVGSRQEITRFVPDLKDMNGCPTDWLQHYPRAPPPYTPPPRVLSPVMPPTSSQLACCVAPVSAPRAPIGSVPHPSGYQDTRSPHTSTRPNSHRPQQTTTRASKPVPYNPVLPTAPPRLPFAREFAEEIRASIPRFGDSLHSRQRQPAMLASRSRTV